ncbi:MAG: Hpt domain-containing protein [Candidatus Hydrogenedentes bacterium]|nr:Hpt domain-containing protein [Candidatus Hydrogenedentota bacterium]
MEATPQNNEPPPINVARLCDTFGDDPEFMAEMYGLYLSDAGQRLTELDAALGTSDTEKIASVAHTLKGTSGNVGAERMSALAAELEQVDSAQAPQKAQDLATALKAEFEAVRAFLKHYVHSPL